MKKTLICIAIVVVGSLTSLATERDAKKYGPVKVYDEVTIGQKPVYTLARYAQQDKNILAVYTNADGDIRFELHKAGTTTELNKKDTSTLNADTQYLADGSATWNADDVSQIRIVGFRNKSVVIRYRFKDPLVTRFYSYTLKNNATPKILGSTKNILNANYTDSTSDGKKVWIQADFDDSGTQTFKEFTNRLEGTLLKPKTAKTFYDLGALEDDTILPLIKNQYNYTKTTNVDDGDGDIYDSITIHK